MLLADAFSVAAMSAAVNGIKYSVKRMRPDNSTRNSFPSGHTAASFAAAGAMYFSKYKHWKAFGVIALAIAFSRLYLYVHFPTDVIGGAALGIACAYAAHRIYTAAERKNRNL